MSIGITVSIVLRTIVSYVEDHRVEIEIPSGLLSKSYDDRMLELVKLAKEKYLDGESERISQEPVESQDYNKHIESNPVDVQFV
jgi:hypothetical protein